MNWLVERRRLLLAGAAVAAAALAGVIFAAHDAKHRILQALGPRATVGSISLNYPTVTLHDVKDVGDSVGKVRMPPPPDDGASTIHSALAKVAAGEATVVA